jgi:hypothetical protein
MFDSYKRLNHLKDYIKKTQIDCVNEIHVCDEFLKDLPEDISNVDELSNMIDNNKDMSRAYDLGRKIAYEEILKSLSK